MLFVLCDFFVPKGFRKVEISMISLEACQSTHSILISYLKKGSVNKAKKSPNSILGKIRETIFQPLLSLPSEREVLSKKLFKCPQHPTGSDIVITIETWSSVNYVPAVGTSSSLFWWTSGACCRDQFIPLLVGLWCLLSGPVHTSSGILSGVPPHQSRCSQPIQSIRGNIN